MTTALLADDEPHLARALGAELQALWPELQIVHMARHGLEAAERIAALQPDIAFLDIQMPGLTGLQVAQGIEGPTRVVFVTAYDEFAVQAFDAEAVDYVLKPVSRERLKQTVQRLQRQPVPDPDEAALAAVLQRLAPASASTARLRWVRASAGELTHQIAVEEVLFFHADDKYTCVQTATAEHLIRTPISELQQQLDPDIFWQIHRSTLVNVKVISAITRDFRGRQIVSVRGHKEQLEVSRSYAHLFKGM